MDDRFYEKYADKINENVSISTNNQCILWTGCTKGTGVKYGAVSCKFRCGNRRTITAHRLSYMLHHRRTFIRANLDASHLCHNSLCVTATHVSLEPHGVNNERISCVKSGECRGHGIYPACMLDLKLNPLKSGEHLHFVGSSCTMNFSDV